MTQSYSNRDESPAPMATEGGDHPLWQRSPQSVTEDELRAAFDRMNAAIPSDISRLRLIDAIGVYKPVRIGGDGPDDIRLTQILQYCLKTRIPIHADFVITPYNLVYGDDYLKTDTPADMVFTSFIMTPDRRIGFRPVVDTTDPKGIEKTGQEICTDWRTTDEGRLASRFQLDPDYITKRAFYRARSIHDNDDAWHRRVVTAGAKMVWTYGGDIELGTWQFAINPLRSIIPSIDAAGIGNWDQDQIGQDYRGDHFRHWDLPDYWFGLCATDDYAAQLAQIVTPATTMADALNKAGMQTQWQLALADITENPARMVRAGLGRLAGATRKMMRMDHDRR